MLDVSGNNIIAHYHAEPDEDSPFVLKFHHGDGPYNNFLVDTNSKTGPLLFHYTLHSPVLANLLRRYQGLYRERLSSSYAPRLRITSDEECRAAEEEAEEEMELDVCIEFALAAKLVNVVFAPHASWRRIGRGIAAHKAKTAPTITQRAFKWLSGPFTHRNPVRADVVAAEPALSPLSPSKVSLEPRVESTSFIDSPPSYASPPPYSPPRLSAHTTSPPSRPSPSPKLLSQHSSTPTTQISHGEFTPVKTPGYLLPKEVSFPEGGTYEILTLSPRIPEVPPTIPLPYKALMFVGEVLGPFVPLLEALVDQGVL
ncbi:hypothetical protein P7C70_g8598, partial [Phenoliferia sp. Uapishka_3]